MSRRPCIAIVLIAFALVSACTGGSSDGDDGGAYVALGDSYVAGPGIGREDPSSPVCRRSQQNYPSLVAVALDPDEFIDVSCGGATTATVRDGKTTPGRAAIEPQLDAVSSDATVVTIGIGGNDGGASAGLFASCLIATSATDRACRTFTSDYLPKVYGATRERVDKVLSRIKRKAPHARVLLVGYLRIVPEAGRCAVLPISAANRAAAERVETSWNTMLRKAAQEADVTFVDLRPVSRGHDACAGDDAWVNGIRNVPGDGAFLHPTAAGMQNAAREVLRTLRR